MEELSQVIENAYVSTIHSDIPIEITQKGKKTTEIISLILAGINGIYLFVIESKKQTEILSEFCRRIRHPTNGIFLFYIEEENWHLFDCEINESILLQDMVEEFQIFYENHLLTEIDKIRFDMGTTRDYLITHCQIEEQESIPKEDTAYVRPVIISNELERIESILEEMENKPILDGKYRVFPDGRMEVQKLETRKLGFLDTMYVQGECWCPCSDENPDICFLFMIFTGWFGFHKWKEKRILSGLLYSLTGGFCGIFYIIDLVAMIMGNYSSCQIIYHETEAGLIRGKQRIFYRPLQKKRAALIGLLASFGIAYFTIYFLYRPIYQMIMIGISGLMAENMSHDQMKELIQILP